jgi:Protein of unknown function (DUF4058)
MPLQDHFHPPLSQRRHWHSFHNAWATYIASDLNTKLPEGYFAEPNVQFGIEIDVATFQEADQEADQQNPDILPFPKSASEWMPPNPTQTIPFALTQEIAEISIFGTESGPVLAGAIELVSPANKDRPTERMAFVAKCETYLRQGIGVIVVDVVTVRRSNLQLALLERLTEEAVVPSAKESPASQSPLFAAAYHPIERNGKVYIDIWQEELAIGTELPQLPLWLRDGICLPVDLAGTYERTCREQRITVA